MIRKGISSSLSANMCRCKALSSPVHAAGCFHASSGHIIGLEAVMEERDAGSKKETVPTDVGHLCAAPTFMPLLPPPAPQTPAKVAERRASGGEPKQQEATSFV